MAEAWGYAIEFRKQRIPLREGLLTLGRSRQCEVTIADPSVSRKHVRLEIQAGKLVLEDLGSSNGTLVNGRRIQGKIELHDQDRIEMGDAVLRLSVEAPQVEAPTVEAPTVEETPDDSPLRTVRLPAVDQPLPRTPGDATFFLQSASVELAKQALSDSGDDNEDKEDGKAASEDPPEQQAAVVDQPPSFDLDPIFTEPPDLPSPDLPAPDLSLKTQQVPESSFADIFADPEPQQPPADPPPSPAPAAPTPTPAAPAMSSPRTAPQGAPTDDIPTEELATAQPRGVSAPTTPAPVTGTDRPSPASVAAPAVSAPATAPKQPGSASVSPPTRSDAPASKPDPPDPASSDASELPVLEPIGDLISMPFLVGSPDEAPRSGQDTAPRPPVPPSGKAPVPSGLEALAGEAWQPPPRSASRSQDILPTLDELEAAIGPQLPELPMRRSAQEASPVEAQTAEPVALEPAGFWRRALALVLDDLWILALSLGAAAAWGGPMTPEGQQVAGTVAACLGVVVFWIGWGFWGTTPGKKALGLYVCTSDGRTGSGRTGSGRTGSGRTGSGRPGSGQPGIGLGRALIRLLGYAVSAALLGLGFLMVAFGSSKKALHDLLAGTYVGSQ